MRKLLIIMFILMFVGTGLARAYTFTFTDSSYFNFHILYKTDDATSFTLQRDVSTLNVDYNNNITVYVLIDSREDGSSNLYYVLVDNFTVTEQDYSLIADDNYVLTHAFINLKDETGLSTASYTQYNDYDGFLVTYDNGTFELTTYTKDADAFKVYDSVNTYINANVCNVRYNKILYFIYYYDEYYVLWVVCADPVTDSYTNLDLQFVVFKIDYNGTILDYVTYEEYISDNLKHYKGFLQNETTFVVIPQASGAQSIFYKLNITDFKIYRETKTVDEIVIYDVRNSQPACADYNYVYSIVRSQRIVDNTLVDIVQLHTTNTDYNMFFYLNKIIINNNEVYSYDNVRLLKLTSDTTQIEKIFYLFPYRNSTSTNDPTIIYQRNTVNKTYENISAYVVYKNKFINYVEYVKVTVKELNSRETTTVTLDKQNDFTAPLNLKSDTEYIVTYDVKYNDYPYLIRISFIATVSRTTPVLTIFDDRTMKKYAEIKIVDEMLPFNIKDFHTYVYFRNQYTGGLYPQNVVTEKNITYKGVYADHPLNWTTWEFFIMKQVKMNIYNFLMASGYDADEINEIASKYNLQITDLISKDVYLIILQPLGIFENITTFLSAYEQTQVMYEAKVIYDARRQVIELYAPLKEDIFWGAYVQFIYKNKVSPLFSIQTTTTLEYNVTHSFNLNDFRINIIVNNETILSLPPLLSNDIIIFDAKTHTTKSDYRFVNRFDNIVLFLQKSDVIETTLENARYTTIIVYVPPESAILFGQASTTYVIKDYILRLHYLIYLASSAVLLYFTRSINSLLITSIVMFFVTSNIVYFIIIVFVALRAVVLRFLT